MIGNAMKDGLQSLQNLSADDILSVLGLERLFEIVADPEQIRSLAPA